MAFVLILSGCGEAGIQSDVSKNVEIDPVSVEISVPAAAVGVLVTQTPPVEVNTGPIDISDAEFDEYLEDATNFTINQITYSIERFPNGSQADLNVELDIQIQGQQRQALLTTSVEDAQNNTVDVMLYDRNAPGNVSSTAIADLELALRNGSSFEIFMTIVGEDVILQEESVDFDFIFSFDVTARVELD